MKVNPCIQELYELGLVPEGIWERFSQVLEKVDEEEDAHIFRDTDFHVVIPDNEWMCLATMATLLYMTAYQQIDESHRTRTRTMMASMAASAMSVFMNTSVQNFRRALNLWENVCMMTKIMEEMK